MPAREFNVPLTISNDLVAAYTFDVGCKTYTASILFKLWVIETLLLRQCTCPRLVVGIVLVRIDVDRFFLNVLDFVDSALFYIIGERDSTHSIGKLPCALECRCTVRPESSV